MIDVKATIAVSMAAERWQQVLSLLAAVHAPHTVSDPLIRDIYAQCMAADGQGSHRPETAGDV